MFGSRGRVPVGVGGLLADACSSHRAFEAFDRLPNHVSPFPSAVAAEASGYRPCLRCRPDRRAHFARRLLDESDLTMTAIAGASGLGSVRQMNRVVELIFGFAPGALRVKRHDDVLTVDGGLRLRLVELETEHPGVVLRLPSPATPSALRQIVRR